MTPWSNYTSTTGTKLSRMSWCTSICVHHTQLCSDEGTLVSKSPLTTGYESSLPTPTHQKTCPNHQASGICFFMKLIKPCTEETASAPIQLSRILWVSICRVGFLTLHLFFISKTVQLGSHQKAVHPPSHIPQAGGLGTGGHQFRSDRWICESIFPPPKCHTCWLLGITKCRCSSLLFSMRKGFLT